MEVTRIRKRVSLRRRLPPEILAKPHRISILSPQLPACDQIKVESDG
jgi:hypothetical protein